MNRNKFVKCFLITIIFLIAYSENSNAQIDSAAIVILDKMSNVLCDLESCSFKISTEYDIYNDKLGLVKHSDKANVFMKAPDKLLVNRDGDKGRKDFFYDGKSFSYLSFDNNQYASIEAPPTIMELIENFNDNYGIEFPAADLFNPDLVDDILATANYLSYLGITSVEDKECFHIAGSREDLTFQIWIANNESFLPLKMVIVYKNQNTNPQYEAMFRDWELNPVLQDTMFDFIAPAEAIKVKFVAKKN